MSLGSRAHFLYGQSATGESTIDLVPRSKFNFTVLMTHINQTQNQGTTETDFRRIASISMPSYAARTTTLNQYNRKRVVQTGIDYSPITMIAYDDRMGSLEKFLKDYSNYYYAGTMNYGPERSDFLTQPSGLKIPQGIDTNYIKTLRIFRRNSLSDINEIEIYNPIITNIDADTLDYSDSGTVQYRITFIYEGYSIVTDGSETSDAVAERVEQANTTSVYTPPSSIELPERQTKSDEVVDENIVDSRSEEDLVGVTRAERGTETTGEVDPSFVSDDRRYDNLGEALLDDSVQPGEMVVVDGKVYEAIPTGYEENPVYFEEQNVALVGQEQVYSEKVLYENRDSQTGEVTDRVVEVQGRDADGFEYTETKRVPAQPVEYRKFDQYVGMPIEDIPEDVLVEIENSYAYQDAGDGTLMNYADTPTHDEIMSTVVTPDQGFTDYNQRTGEHIGYNATLNESDRFETAQEAIEFAQSGNSEPVSERFTGPANGREADIQRRLEEKRERARKRREEMGEDAYQAMLDKYRPVSQRTGQVDEVEVMSQFVAPSMSADQLREEGGKTQAPLPNPDLIAKADSFDSDGDPTNNSVESDSFETDPDPYEDITDEYLNED